MRLARYDRWGAYLCDVRPAGEVTRTRVLADYADELEFATFDEVDKGDRIVFTDAAGEVREYEVVSLDTKRGAHSPKTTVYATDAISEIDSFLVDYEASGATAEECLAQVLAPTRWSAGTCETGTTIGSCDVSWSHESCYSALLDICEDFGLEIQTSYTLNDLGTGVSGRHISLLEARGEDKGRRFAFGKDLPRMRVTTASARPITRLYAYGADGLTLEDAYGAAYIDAGTASTWGTLDASGAAGAVCGSYTNTDANTAAQLLAYAEAYLAAACEPTVSYEMDILVYPDSGEEPVSIGDVVRIVDDSFPTAVRLEARVSKLVEFYSGATGATAGAESSTASAAAALAVAASTETEASASVELQSCTLTIGAVLDDFTEAIAEDEEAIEEAIEEASSTTSSSAPSPVEYDGDDWVPLVERDSSVTSVTRNDLVDIGRRAFAGWTSIESVYLTGLETIATYAFYSCTALTSLTLDSDEVVALAGTSAFSSTPIYDGEGSIYVPSDLLEEYQSATNWSTFAGCIVGV